MSEAAAVWLSEQTALEGLSNKGRKNKGAILRSTVAKMKPNENPIKTPPRAEEIAAHCSEPHACLQSRDSRVGCPGAAVCTPREVCWQPA